MFEGEGGPREPLGRELWWADIENITVSALLAAGLRIAPGDWIAYDSFKQLIGTAKVDPSQIVVSTVTTDQAGVSKPWQSTIEVEEPSAALMVCHAVIGHVDGLEMVNPTDVWVRVE